MAHRIITQIAVTGARVFGRAFAEAYKQANARRISPGAAGGGGGSASSPGGMALDEAVRILNVTPPKVRGPTVAAEEAAAAEARELEIVMERFKKLFDQNDPTKGGSFYLQSKVLRARERLEAEIGGRSARAREQAEMREMPKVYKPR